MSRVDLLSCFKALKIALFNFLCFSEGVQRKRWILLDQLHAQISSFTIKTVNMKKENQEAINELAYLLCRLYFEHILCSKTSQRIAKVKIVCVIMGQCIP